jgi:alanine transaminase
MTNPPRDGDASYALYQRERDGILISLKRRAVSLAKTLNTIPGIRCNPVEG